MAGYVDVRAYAELNDFLGPESRGVTVRRPFQPHQASGQQRSPLRFRKSRDRTRLRRSGDFMT